MCSAFSPSCYNLLALPTSDRETKMPISGTQGACLELLCWTPRKEGAGVAHSCSAMTLIPATASASACQAFRPCSNIYNTHVHTHWSLLREGCLIFPLGDYLFAGCHGNTMLEKQATWTPGSHPAPSLNRPWPASTLDVQPRVPPNCDGPGTVGIRMHDEVLGVSRETFRPRSRHRKKKVKARSRVR